MYRVAIITSSDAGYRKEREDASGPVIREIVEQNGYQAVSYVVLPDEQQMLEEEMKKIADEDLADLIVTTGGTGFSPRDCMPEATLAVSERMVPGIPEAMRAYSLRFTKRSMLSRAAAGIRLKSANRAFVQFSIHFAKKFAGFAPTAGKKQGNLLPAQARSEAL